mmetsp:Transcript_23112/g.32235  ORF Transcript_23112/g.32235 Transcript_23112/m.32235 type:complete len:263 (+) Transcript_23112:938-1726(+)
MEIDCNTEADSLKDDASQTKRLILKSFVSQICSGVPFYKCNLPLVAWEGISFLEKLSHFFTCSPMLMVRVKEIPDFVGRFFAVIALYLSGWHAFPLDIKKPFTPVQGEIFQCSFVHGNFKVYYLAEQVQPSVTAFCVWSPQLKMFLEATLSLRTKYHINSVDTILDGTLIGTDVEHNETYIMSYPSISVGGIVWGKLHASIIGEVKIHCPEKGYTAILSFEKGKHLSGEIQGPNSVKPLFQLKGNWNSIVYLEDCNEVCKQP